MVPPRSGTGRTAQVAAKVTILTDRLAITISARVKLELPQADSCPTAEGEAKSKVRLTLTWRLTVSLRRPRIQLLTQSKLYDFQTTSIGQTADDAKLDTLDVLALVDLRERGSSPLLGSWSWTADGYDRVVVECAPVAMGR